MINKRIARSALITIVAALGVQSAGANPPGDVGSVCGGIAGLQCREGLFCDFPVSAMCGAADQTGTCAKRPQVCTREYRPVCGCDDKTYANDCMRRSAGVSKAKDGPCSSGGK